MFYKKENNDSLKDRMTKDSITLRRFIIKYLHQSGGGHFGGALSVADVLLVILKYIVNLNSGNCNKTYRDRIILSKGHTSIALYCLLAMQNIIDIDTLDNYGGLNAGLEGHPDMTVTPGVDFSTGSLGQGISAGIGMALALKNKNSHVWVIVGDGECQEGQIWEAAAFAERYKINNLHVIVDCNGAQEFGFKHDKFLLQKPLINPENKWRAFGWNVTSVNGHNHLDILHSCHAMMNHSNGPSVLIAQTKKGYGVNQFERNPEEFHCTELSEYQFQKALKEASSCKNLDL